MLSSTRSQIGSSMKSQPVIIQSRNISRRMLAYPSYPTKRVERQSSKDHTTNFRFYLRQFLGPQNITGEYYLNKYYYPPQSHTPNYIAPDLERGNSLHIIDEEELHQEANERQRQKTPDRVLQPFPHNPFCKTNHAISHQLKNQIVQEVADLKIAPQEVAVKHGLKIPRIEAIVKLQEIEAKMRQENKITEEMDKMASVMYKMFPLHTSQHSAENLTEIPIPKKTLKARFLTIAESEPFGPIDAAEHMDLEPASQTLDKLTEIGEAAVSAGRKIVNKGFTAPVLEGEKNVFRFTEAKVGEVGHRYGAGNRDNRKDRRIAYNSVGRMVYA